MKAKMCLLMSSLLLCALALLFAFPGTSFAQPPPPAGQAPKPFQRPSIKNLPAQRAFVSIDAGYSISLPEATYSNNWMFQEGQIGINVIKAGIAGSVQELQAISERYNEALLSKIKGKIMDEKFYQTDELPASITRFAFDDGRFGVRKFVLARANLYIMFALFNDSADTPVVESAFDTFKIVGKAEIDAEIQRKFEEATPQNLPQTPALKNQPSDAKEENLKGKIKKIVEESETVSNEIDKNNKRIVEIREYDKAGNLTKTVSFDYRGNPDSINVYGFIDGKRVSKTGYVKYPYNPPPAALPSKNQTEPKRDLRYSTSYEKKYKDGKVIEEIIYGNNGTAWSRQVSNYKDNQLEFLVYSADGTLNRKFVSTLDKKGLVVGETSFDVKTDKPYADRKRSYAYEFDRKGNWIKKTTSNEATENGKTFFKPLYVYYRTISYYE